MKNKDFLLFAVSAVALGAFMLIPYAAGYTVDADFPGIAFCQGWIQAGENFIASLH